MKIEKPGLKQPTSEEPLWPDVLAPETFDVSMGPGQTMVTFMPF